MCHKAGASGCFGYISSPAPALTTSIGSRGRELRRPYFCRGRYEVPRGVDRNGCPTKCSRARMPPSWRRILRRESCAFDVSRGSNISCSSRAKKSAEVSIVSEETGAHHPGSATHATRALAQVWACRRLQDQVHMKPHVDMDSQVRVIYF